MYDKNYQNRSRQDRNDQDRNDRNANENNSWGNNSWGRQNRFSNENSREGVSYNQASHRTNEDWDNDQTTGGNWGQTRSDRSQQSNRDDNSYSRNFNDRDSDNQNFHTDRNVRRYNDQHSRYSEGSHYDNRFGNGRDQRLARQDQNELERNERSTSNYGRDGAGQDWDSENRFNHRNRNDDRNEERSWNLDNGRFQTSRSGYSDDRDNHLRGQGFGTQDQWRNRHNHQDESDIENNEYAQRSNRNRSSEWRHNY